MNINHILCPVDFSDFNQAANQYASVLAQSSGAKITYFHVALPDVSYGAYGYIDIEAEKARDKKRLEEIRPTVDGVEWASAIGFGTPATAIVEFADENDIDLIVIGTHGRTGLRRVVMGSVAEAVVRKAQCPVLAIKPDSSVAESNEPALQE